MPRYPKLLMANLGPADMMASPAPTPAELSREFCKPFCRAPSTHEKGHVEGNDSHGDGFEDHLGGTAAIAHTRALRGDGKGVASGWDPLMYKGRKGIEHRSVLMPSLPLLRNPTPPSLLPSLPPIVPIVSRFGNPAQAPPRGGGPRRDGRAQVGRDVRDASFEPMPPPTHQTPT